MRLFPLARYRVTLDDPELHQAYHWEGVEVSEKAAAWRCALASRFDKGYRVWKPFATARDIPFVWRAPDDYIPSQGLLAVEAELWAVVQRMSWWEFVRELTKRYVL